MARDREYWNEVIKSLTPFEASELGVAICECFEAGETDIIPIVSPDVIADTISVDDMAMLFENLAQRKDVVQALTQADRHDWCSEGKAAVRSLLEKRKQLFLFIEQQGREVQHG
jgi:hypothetical protein